MSVGCWLFDFVMVVEVPVRGRSRGRPEVNVGRAGGHDEAVVLLDVTDLGTPVEGGHTH